MNLFSPPSLDDLIRLLRAWRFWLLAALLGALLGASAYFIAPPPYRARATVNVDFNLEQAWPRESDRQQFYYLEREARKLEEIAWSDAVLEVVAAQDGALTIGDLRQGKLMLSQPAEAGWHFYAEDGNPQRAETLASTWARAFANAAQTDLAAQGEMESFIRVEVTQAAELPRRRRLPLSTYLLAGALSAWFLGALLVLFFDPRSKARGKP